MKIDWKRKLTSRKFWVGMSGIITGLVIFFTRPDKSSPEAITSMVMSFGSGIAYIIGEGLADGGNHSADAGNMVESDETENNNGTDN